MKVSTFMFFYRIAGDNEMNYYSGRQPIYQKSESRYEEDHFLKSVYGNFEISFNYKRWEHCVCY